MLKSPINRNPSRPPRLPLDLFRSRRISRQVAAVEILPGKDIPIAVEKRALQIRRQSLQRLLIAPICRVNRVIEKPRRNEIVILYVVFLRTLHPRRRLLVDPQRLYPRVPDVPQVRRPGHAWKRPRHRTAIEARQKLPLPQSKQRQLINPDK
jgi:hypothetical protein